MKRARARKACRGARGHTSTWACQFQVQDHKASTEFSNFGRSSKRQLNRKTVPHGVRFRELAIFDFPAIQEHPRYRGYFSVLGTRNKILSSADPCPYLSGRSNPGVILQLISLIWKEQRGPAGKLNFRYMHMHMRMQVSTGRRFIATQMLPINDFPLHALKSTVASRLSPLIFWLPLLCSCLRCCCYLFLHSASSQRLGRDPIADPLFSLFFKLQVPNTPPFSSGILHTHCCIHCIGRQSR